MHPTVTPTKLRNGSWGAKGPASIERGDIVTVTTRSGKSWDAHVDGVVWTNGEISILATSSAGPDRTPRSTSRTISGATSGGTRTGCSCGSREDADGNLMSLQTACWNCRHDA